MIMKGQLAASNVDSVYILYANNMQSIGLLCK